MHILTYGCQMNDYESDRTYRLFHNKYGYSWADHPHEADLVIFNTCSIREKADQKAFSALGELKKTKAERKQHMIIAVGGCSAQLRGKEIQSKFPFVDIVFGTHQWNKLPELVEASLKKNKRQSNLDLFGWQKYSFLDVEQHQEQDKHPVTELITVQNGCDKFCSFCVVPYTRGRQVSRDLDDICREVEKVAQKGTKEVILLGQNVNAYGNDKSSDIGFSKLLRSVAAVDGIERIRYVTSHPSELSFEMIDTMAELDEVCNSLHLPIQSGSNRILKAMNRDYTVDRFREVANYLYKAIPDMILTTDLMVAFPGETEEDFKDTLSAMQEFNFAESYSFLYSPRPQTKAAKREEDFIPTQVGKQRLYELQDLQNKLSMRARQNYLGKTVKVLVDGLSARDSQQITGKMEQNWSVNFDGSSSLIGKIVEVKIDQVMSNTFKGQLITTDLEDSKALPSVG